LRSVSRTLNGNGMPSAIRCLTVDRGQHCISPAPFEVRRRANCQPTRPGAVCTFDTLRADMNAGFVGNVRTTFARGAKRGQTSRSAGHTGHRDEFVARMESGMGVGAKTDPGLHPGYEDQMKKRG